MLEASPVLSFSWCLCFWLSLVCFFMHCCSAFSSTILAVHHSYLVIIYADRMHTDAYCHKMTETVLHVLKEIVMWGVCVDLCGCAAQLHSISGRYSTVYVHVLLSFCYLSIFCILLVMMLQKLFNLMNLNILENVQLCAFYLNICVFLNDCKVFVICMCIYMSYTHELKLPTALKHI